MALQAVTYKIVCFRQSRLFMKSEGINSWNFKSYSNINYHIAEMCVVMGYFTFPLIELNMFSVVHQPSTGHNDVIT